MHQDTLKPSSLDGAWLNISCKCSGKDTAPPEVQWASTLIVNGNLLFQNRIGRLKKTESDRYCSIQEEANIERVSGDEFEVTTISERTFSPGAIDCEVYTDIPKRIWKIILVNKSDLKLESTSGCEGGQLICAFRRLDQ